MRLPHAITLIVAFMAQASSIATNQWDILRRYVDITETAFASVRVPLIVGARAPGGGGGGGGHFAQLIRGNFTESKVLHLARLYQLLRMSSDFSCMTLRAVLFSMPPPPMRSNPTATSINLFPPRGVYRPTSAAVAVLWKQRPHTSWRSGVRHFLAAVFYLSSSLCLNA